MSTDTAVKSFTDAPPELRAKAEALLGKSYVIARELLETLGNRIEAHRSEGVEYTTTRDATTLAFTTLLLLQEAIINNAVTNSVPLSKIMDMLRDIGKHGIATLVEASIQGDEPDGDKEPKSA